MENSNQTSYKMLNLGCGDQFHKDWINLDVIDYGGKVIRYNLNLGIPFCDDTFDFVYHSHIIEHFEAKRARYFLKECFRVLKDGATLRIAFPDLEMIAKNYVKALDDIEAGIKGADDRREWMTLELYDQVVRNQSGGEGFAKYLSQENIPEINFILDRWGDEGKRAIRNYQNIKNLIHEPPMPAIPITDENFKQSGELHQWMYDFYALKKILEEIGFVNIQRQTFDNSSFKEYLKYNFDKSVDGKIRKPDSMFIEAMKPQNLNKEKKLKVCVFNSYDYGGAAIAALRQHYALRKIGIKSEFYTGTAITQKDSVHIVPTYESYVITDKKLGAIQNTFIAGLNERPKRKVQYPPEAQLSEFDFTYGDCFNPNSIPLFNDFDIVNLEWVAGFADPSEHPENYKNIPIVWTLHDMLPLTGNCHYAGKCEKFTSNCGACPLLCSSNPNDVAGEYFRNKLEAYKNLNIHIVTPSEWMAEQARKSKLTSHFPVHVIRYAQPLNTFKPIAERDILRAGFQISEKDIVLLFTADTFDVKRKGGKHIIKLLQNLAQTELAPRILVIVLGRDAPKEIKNTGIRTSILGFIKDENKIASIYNMADALVVSSLEDNYPNTICESLACGTPVIAFKSGGIPEMIEHQKTGFLAEKENDEELLEGVKWLSRVYRNQDIRKACREFALENLDEEKQAKKYEELYYQILKEQDAKLGKENSLSTQTTNQSSKNYETKIIQEDYPLVSVVIPCYNQANFLPEAVESVVNQTYPNIEIILVNDGSSDNTQEVANNLIKQYGNIRPIKLINKENGGVASARNTGIKEAKGFYISNLDADDIFEKNYIETGVNALYKQDKNLFSSNVQEFEERSEKWTTPIYDSYELRNSNIIPTGAIFEKSLFEKSGGFKENLWIAEDWEFWLNLSRYGVKPAKSQESLIRYRVRGGETLTNLYIKDHYVDLQHIVQFVNDDLYSVEEILKAHDNILSFSENSIKKAKKNIKKHPDDWFLNFFLGLIEEKKNNLSSALEYYKHAKKITNDKNWQVLYRMNAVLTKQNNQAKFPDLIRKIMTLRPDTKNYLEN